MLPKNPNVKASERRTEHEQFARQMAWEGKIPVYGGPTEGLYRMQGSIRRYGLLYLRAWVWIYTQVEMHTDWDAVLSEVKKMQGDPGLQSLILIEAEMSPTRFLAVYEVSDAQYSPEEVEGFFSVCVKRDLERAEQELALMGDKKQEAR